eukprot:252873_1
MAASCVRKRKLNDNEQISQNEGSPTKKLKLDDSKQNECKNKEIAVTVDENSFDITIGSINTINLFALHTINNSNNKEESDTLNPKLGATDWTFEFYEMPTDSSHNIYQFLDGLFGDKLCDWKEYIMADNKYLNKSSNNFITIIKDGFGIWRGAILFIIYELTFKDNNNIKYLIKIPLTGVDLHFRRQNVGTILVNYMVSIIHKIMGCNGNKYEIIVLVIDDTQAKSFWNKNNFVSVIGYKGIKYSNIFSKDLMIKKGFLKNVENELIIMIYSGEKSIDLVLNDERVKGFKKPKYVNFNQRYCKKDEIEETEKNIKEWERKKKELKEKQKIKNDNIGGKFNELEFDDDESDEDFDVEKAIECQSSDSDENNNDNNDNNDNNINK